MNDLKPVVTSKSRDSECLVWDELLVLLLVMAVLTWLSSMILSHEGGDKSKELITLAEIGFMKGKF